MKRNSLEPRKMHHRTLVFIQGLATFTIGFVMFLIILGVIAL